jgi:UDP-glucose 4-epimerase
MRILITGAFGNVGTSLLHELALDKHQVRCFDLKNPRTEKVAARYASRVDVAWGDVRRLEDVQAAVKDCDVVIHLIAIIPPQSIAQPDLTRSINVGGTKNIITALKAMPKPAKLIYSSSLALFGQTQHMPPPRTVADPIQIMDVYTETKAECETLIKESGLTWAILRFAAVLPLDVLSTIDPLMFEVPLTDRAEFVHTRDVGLALANAAQSETVWGKILLIGGGKRCQMYQRELIAKPLQAMGIGMMPDHAFSTVSYHLDWLDTSESQAILQYQRHSFDDYVRDIVQGIGWRRPFIRILGPIIRRYLLSTSPYYRQKSASKA